MQERQAGKEVLEFCTGCFANDLRPMGNENISVCGSCGLIFDNPRPSAAVIKEFYSRAGQYDGWLSEIDLREELWRRRLSKLLRVDAPRGSLLDVGAGIGQFLHHARTVFSEVHGTEVSSSAIGVARTRFDLELTEGNLEDLPSHGRKFDVITAFHVLEHVPFPGKFLDKCFELLEEGGVLVVAVPNDVRSFNAHARRLFRKLGLGKYSRYSALGLPVLALKEATEEVHLSHFTEASLRTLLEARGFKVEQAGLDPYFVARGLPRLRHELAYGMGRVLRAVTGLNLFDALWVAARKPRTH